MSRENARIDAPSTYRQLELSIMALERAKKGGIASEIRFAEAKYVLAKRIHGSVMDAATAVK